MKISSVQFWSLIAIILVLIAIIAPLGRLAHRQRQRLKGRPNFLKVPIPHISLSDWHPIFKWDGLGPNVASEVAFIGGGTLKLGTNDTETWVLAAHAKNAKHIFEIGTATGRTTYVLARNAPEDARIDTLTLPNEYEKFYYEDTPVVSKISQHFGDSAAFDETRFSGKMDMIFIDGCHEYDYVLSDTEKALNMIKPGGVIFWHDYSPRMPGNFRALNELASKLPLVHLKDTRLVACYCE